MTDIVKRLRTFDSWEKLIKRHKLVQDAADEIERLRAALRKIRAGEWGPDEYLEDLMREALDD